MSARLDQIIELIKEEADKINNPDPISRLYNVEMQIQNKIIEEMSKIREGERNAIS